MEYKSFTGRKGGFTIGLDIEVEFLKHSRAKYETGKITWICVNAMSLPFQKESLDGVVIAELLRTLCLPPRRLLRKPVVVSSEEDF